MSAGQEGDVVGIAFEAEVETACPFKMGGFVRCDSQAKSGGKRHPQSREIVEKGVEGGELGTGAGTMDYGFHECHLDSGITKFDEDLMDGSTSGNGSVVKEGVRLHADGNDEIANEIGLSGVGVRKGVDGSQRHLQRVECSGDTPEDRGPSTIIRNRVAVNGASLSQDPVSLGTRAFRPGRARLVHAGGAAPVEVGVSVFVVIGESDDLLWALIELLDMG